MFGYKGTLLASSAFYAAAAIAPIAALIAPAAPAIAQSVSLIHSGVTTTFTTIGAIGAAFNAMAMDDTIVVQPGPSATCIGTIAAGATSCVLSSANPYSVGEVIVFGSLNTSTGVWGNGLSPSVPFSDTIIAIAGNTITWTQTAYQQAVNPQVNYDYAENQITFDWGGTLTCAVTDACHVIPTMTTGSGNGIIKIGLLGENPGGETGGADHVVINGMDLEGAGTLIKKTICYTPNANGGTSGPENGLTYCPGMVTPGGGDGIFYISGDNVTVTNNVLAWNSDAFLADPPVNGHGTVDIASNVIRFNGDNSGQDHNLYVGRFASGTITGNLITHSWSGADVKCRAVVCVITSNTIGAVNAVIGNGSTISDYSGNRIQIPDLGNTTVTGNIIYAGPGATNTNPVAFQGVVMPWPNSAFLMSGNTMTVDVASLANAFLWNGQDYGTAPIGGGTCDVDFRNNTLTLIGTPAIPLMIGLGCQSGNTLNGTLQATSTLTVPYLGVPNLSTTICDFSTGSLPCTLATAPYAIVSSIKNATLIEGDSHSLTVDNTGVAGSWAAQQIVFGLGGGTYAGPAALVLDNSSGASSTYAVTQSAPQSYFLLANGDTLTYNTSATNSGGYAEVGSSNFLINECSLTTNCAYLIEVKTSVPDAVPTGTIKNNGGGLAKGILLISGGFVTISGAMSTLGGLYLNCASNTIICGSTYAVAILDNSFQYKGVASSGTLVGAATQGRPGAYIGAGFPGYPDYMFNPTGDWGGSQTRNDTIWFGSGTGFTGTMSDDPALVLDRQGFIPGSGSAQFSAQPNTRGIIELVNGYGGGTFTISNFGGPAASNGIQIMQVGFSGNAFGSPSVVKTATTIPAVDGTQIILGNYTGSINYTPPVSNSLTLTVPASQTVVANTTAAITGMSATDPNSASYDGGMNLLREYATAGTIVPGGLFANFATISTDGKTLTALAPFKMMNDILAHESYVAGAANAVLTVDYSDQFGYETVTTNSLVITSAGSTDLILTGSNNITITPSSTAVVDVGLADPWAAGQGGTLVANIDDASGSPLIFNGTTYGTGTIAIGLSFTAMVNAFASLVYSSNGAPSDQIVASVTNQGGYSQSITVNVISNPAVDLSVDLPSSVTATAAIPLHLTGTLAPNISDAWAQANAQLITVTESTDYGTLTLNGSSISPGQTATLTGKVGDINVILAAETFTAGLSGVANVTVTGNNGAGGFDSESVMVGVLAQGTSTDLSLIVPQLLVAPVSGTISVAGGSISSPWSNTTPGPMTMKLNDTFSTLVSGGTAVVPGHTLTVQDNLAGLNSTLNALQLVAASSANCDYIAVSVTNQGSVTQTGTITVNTAANAVILSVPSTASVPVNSTVVLTPFSFTETVPAQTTLTVNGPTLGSLIIGSNTLTGGASQVFVGTPDQLNAIFASVTYLSGPATGNQTITFGATTANGVVATPVHTTLTITSGATGTCPLP